mgnify:CR=1 FL=1
MFRAVLTKEIRNHLLSFRFLAGFALMMVIVPVTVMILSTDAVRKQDDYSRRQSEIQTYLRSYAHFNRLYAVIAPSQPPIAMLAMVRGLTADVDLDVFDNDPLPVMFPLIDLTFIITILLSLAALVFSYDAVSGDKEDGTLKLTLANAVPRSTVLAGKVLGGAATLFVPFLLSFAAGLIVILLNPRIGWCSHYYLGILPEYRGQGLGVEAMLHGFHAMAAMGGREYHDGTDARNHGALSLFRRLGCAPDIVMEQWRLAL